MKKILTLLVVLSINKMVIAQNPFEQFGHKGKILTATNGRFNEFHDLDSVVQIGSILLDVHKLVIVGDVPIDTVIYMPSPTIISRWLSPDPLSEKLFSQSPYSFSLNNPILFVDPDGQFPYTFHVRAFAPPGSFQNPVRTGFHDDGRGFSASTSSGTTSRIKQNFTVDPTAQTYSGGAPTSDPTYWNGANVGTASNEGGISTPEFGTNSMGSATASLTSNFEGSNPAAIFMGMAPDIEVSSAISITENLKEGKLIVGMDLSSKQFPATEGLIQDAAGNTVFLAGAAAYGNATDLTSADKTKVATVDLVIGINDKGVFQNVTMGGTTYSIEDFNKLRTSTSAGPNPRN